MTLSASAINRLWRDSSPFHGRNHKGWLAEALNAVRATGDASTALELLRQTRRDVTGEQDRKALDDTVGWLERRLRAEPSVDPSRLQLELGWLRRMAVIRAESHAGDDGRRDRGSRDRPTPSRHRSSGR